MEFPTFLSRKNIASPSELGEDLDIKYLKVSGHGFDQNQRICDKKNEWCGTA